MTTERLALATSIALLKTVFLQSDPLIVKMLYMALLTIRLVNKYSVIDNVERYGMNGCIAIKNIGANKKRERYTLNRTLMSDFFVSSKVPPRR